MTGEPWYFRFSWCPKITFSWGDDFYLLWLLIFMGGYFTRVLCLVINVIYWLRPIRNLVVRNFITAVNNPFVYTVLFVRMQIYMLVIVNMIIFNKALNCAILVNEMSHDEFMQSIKHHHIIRVYWNIISTSKRKLVRIFIGVQWW